MSWKIWAVFLVTLLLIAIPGTAEPSRVIEAEAILKNISQGLPVVYDNVTVVGDLDLAGLDLPRVPVERTIIAKFLGFDYVTLVVSPIRLTNSVIRDSIDFNATFFQNVTDFSGTRFEGPVFMLGLCLNQAAYFGDARFNQTAYFGSAQFNQTADFGKARFNQNAHFWDAWFYQAADFGDARFNQNAHFWDAWFNQTPDFGKARFNQIADFGDARFNQAAKFGDARFNQTADFGKARFNQAANFWYARFNQTDFRRAQFNQTDFSGAQFNQESHFEDASIFNAFFNNSQFSKEAFFQGAQITGALSLYRTKYDSLNIRWDSIHDLAYDDTAYHLLIQNFNKLGFSDDAKECQYSYRCKHREELWRKHRFDLWLFDLLAYATYGYGLRPVRTLGWAALFILMGGMFFFLTGSVTRSKEAHAGKKPLALLKREEKPEGYVSIWEALLLSATYFTSGASSIISATPTEFVPLGRGRYVVVLLRLLGWIFFVLFLSSLTRTI